MNQVKLTSANQPRCPVHGPQDTDFAAQTAPCGCEWVWEGDQLIAAPGWGGKRPGAGRPPVNFRIPGLDPDIARWFAGLSDEDKVEIITQAAQS